MQVVKVCRFANAPDQLPAKHLRWKVRFPAAGAPTNITFRIFLNALQVG